MSSYVIERNLYFYSPSLFCLLFNYEWTKIHVYEIVFIMVGNVLVGSMGLRKATQADISFQWWWLHPSKSSTRCYSYTRAAISRQISIYLIKSYNNFFLYLHLLKAENVSIFRWYESTYFWWHLYSKANSYWEWT